MLDGALVESFINKITTAKRVVLLTHLNPDADTFCSAAAMYDVLWRMQKKITLYNFSNEISTNIVTMPYADKIRNKLPEYYDLAIAFDCGSFDRLGVTKIEGDFINIDHHISNELYGSINIVEATMASTTQVVFSLLRSANIKLSQIASQHLLTGLMSDTLSFGTDRVNKAVFEMASVLVSNGADVALVRATLYEQNSLAKIRLASFMLDTVELLCNARLGVCYATLEMFAKTGAQRTDAQEVLELVMSMAVVDTAIMLREEDNGLVKVSLRNKSNIDVSKIAQKFGGGGHLKAAGFEKKSTIEMVKLELIKTIESEYNAKKTK